MLKMKEVSIILTIYEIFLFVSFVHLATDDFFKSRCLFQAGERTFACVGRSVTLKWRYPYPDIINTTWKKQEEETAPITLATWDRADGFRVNRTANVAPGKLNTSDGSGLTINFVEKSDEGLYMVIISTSDSDKLVKTGNTTLYVYEDCPDVSGVQLSISCDAADSGSTSPKTNDFTYGDIVNLTVVNPQLDVIHRLFYYQEAQHKVVTQPIRARCYYRDYCNVVHWTLSKRSMSLAFFYKDPYLTLSLFAHLYHKKALIGFLNTTFRIVDPESSMAKSLTNCKNREASSAISIRRNPFTWNALLSPSLAFTVSNFIHQIILLS